MRSSASGSALTAIGLLFWAAVPCARSAEETQNPFTPKLRDEWTDPDTGHRVFRLSRVPGESQSLYFHQNAFTAAGDKLIFENRPEVGFENRIYVYNFLTKSNELIAEDAGQVILVGRKTRQVYQQRSSTLSAIHLDTRKTKILAELPAGWRVAAVNADETLAAGTFVTAASSLERRAPKGRSLEEIFEAATPRAIFTVNLATGQTNIILRGTNWFNHLQFSPTDPALLQFCHEGPWHRVDRIWHIRTDGTGLRLIHKRSMPMEIAGHEFWSPDGKRVWFDLQMPRGEKFFLAGTDLATGEELRYPLPRDEWSVHYNISRDQKLFAGDGGAPNMVAHAANGKWLYLFSPQPDGTLKSEKLVNMSKHNYRLEPNVNFTPDGKFIVFRGNFAGSAQVYAVQVEK